MDALDNAEHVTLWVLKLSQLGAELWVFKCRNVQNLETEKNKFKVSGLNFAYFV